MKKAQPAKEALDATLEKTKVRLDGMQYWNALVESNVLLQASLARTHPVIRRFPGFLIHTYVEDFTSGRMHPENEWELSRHHLLLAVRAMLAEPQ